jgi:hypothetical protein
MSFQIFTYIHASIHTYGEGALERRLEKEREKEEAIEGD